MADQSNFPEKMDLRSMDISAGNRVKLKQSFPSVFTETRNEKGDLVESIDFEKLKAELGKFSDVFENRRERYGMDWPNKKDAMKLIQQPSVGTLKPCRVESVDFDATENMFIEGDNLEALKLLQKAYYGKVKVICLDPPYNTGKEFIYPDNFSETLDTYLSYAGLADDMGRKFSTNTPNEGRFHTKWLNMMYPRLYLARNLLRDDGMIFIHIDDNEVSNLRKVCDEIFGEENFAAEFIVKSNPRGSQSNAYSAIVHEYALCYFKNSQVIDSLSVELSEEMIQEYKFEDEYGKFRLLGLRLRGGAWKREERPLLFFPIYVNPFNGEVSLEKSTEYLIEIFPIKPSTGEEGTWRWGKEKIKNNIDKIIAKKVQRDGQEAWDIFQKDYLFSNEGKQKGTKVKTIWDEKEFNYQNGTNEIKDLFGGKNIFDFPKPTFFPRRMFEMGGEKDSIILDFFAGSCTTAHAVLDLNKEDGGNRQFIMVQLPESCAPDSEAFKAGYKTIADIGKERIRRVIKKIEAEQAAKGKEAAGQLPGMATEKPPALDLGFKVFKLDKSNFKIWDGADPDISEEKLARQLELFVEHIDPKSSPEDVLYELLLKAGFKLTEPVKKKQLTGKTVFSVADGALLIFLEDNITRELIDAVAEAEPIQFICLDRAFKGNDQLKANAVQTFEARNQGRDKTQQIVFRTV
jgi:adenine-specific DNA-methyltransferase